MLYSDHAQYQYDAQGNCTQHTEHNGETQRYYYNQLNQLQRVDRYTADNTVIRSLYRYDPLGRRLVKQVEHYSIENNQLHETAEAKVEFYGWDGDRLAFTQSEENQWHVIYEPESFTPLLQLQQPTDTPISEQDKVLAEVMGSLQNTLDYLPAHEAYELSRSVREQTIAQLKANEQWQTPELSEECYFYHCNHLGLPEALTNQNGEAVWAASYDAWGNLNQPIRLPGQYHDKETDLYYNRHRYYDPKLGSYINQDPIGLSSGEPNLTVYPRNPVQGVDPLGLYEDPRIGIAQRAAGLGQQNQTVASREKYVLLEKARANNTAIACYRPLGRFPLIINYPGAEKINGVVAHQHIFFPDGTHIGYGRDGIIDENEKLEKYSGCVLLNKSKNEISERRNSLEEVLFRADQYGFLPIGNNCQHAVENLTK